LYGTHLLWDVRFFLGCCYADTLFVFRISEHLRNHSIQPRFFYRCDDLGVEKLFES
jgi:hypothetical protein